MPKPTARQTEIRRLEDSETRARSAGAEHLDALQAAHARIAELEAEVKRLEAALWASEQQAARVFRVAWAVRRMFADVKPTGH